MQSIFLSIAGFSITLLFKSKQKSPRQSLLIKEIHKNLGTYINKNNNVKNDFNIIFTDENIKIVNFLSDDGSRSLDVFTKFFEKKTHEKAPFNI